MTTLTNFYRFRTPIDLSDSNHTSGLCRISNPHSNAFVDLNGDCLAGMTRLCMHVSRRIFRILLVTRITDLFVTCQETPSSPLKFQIWLNEKEKGFVFAMEKELPEKTGQITLADMGTYSAVIAEFRFLYSRV